MGKISRFFGVKNIILAILLSFTFLNWHGYWYVFAVLPIVYALFFYEIYRYCDKVVVLLFLFGFWYSVFATELLMNEYATFMFIYPMMYLVGKYLGLSEKKEGLVNILFFIAVSMAVIYIISVMQDVAKYGFYAQIRDLEIEGVGEHVEVAATGIYSHLMVLTTFIVGLFAKIPLKKKILFVSLAIMAFVVAIRVQSRSAIVIALVTIVLSVFLSFKTAFKSNIIVVIASLVALVYSINYVLVNYEEDLGVLERMQEDDMETGGGRTELAVNVLNKLSESPWGGLEYMGYAHNLWLDCARVAGVIPLLFLLIITVYFICALWKELKISEHDYYRTIIVVIGVSLLVYMNVEPILEGCPLLFTVFVIILGMLRGNRCHSSHSITQKLI